MSRRPSSGKAEFGSALTFVLSLILPSAAAWAEVPSPWLDFSLSSAALTARCAGAREKTASRLDALASLAPASATFQATFQALSDILGDFDNEINAPSFLSHVSPDKEVRDAGHACHSEAQKFLVEVYTREDVYAALKAAAGGGGMLAGEDKRLAEKTLLDFKRAGLELPADKRARVRDLKQKIVGLETQFGKNLGEDKTSVSFAREQLDGLPEEIIHRLPKDGEKFKVSMDYPDYFPFMDNVRDPEARRALEARFNDRGGESNLGLFEEALRLRAQIAGLLGYPSHAHYVLEDRMARDPRQVLQFLTRLEERLKAKAAPELAGLLALKEEEWGLKSDGVVRAWDWRYYHNKLMKTRYQVDEEKIKEYFPLEGVTTGMLRVYETLLGLRFVELSSSGAWHEDVKLYGVSDAQGGGPVAYFYMDLFPREGKYKHAAAFPLVQGRSLQDGSYQKPVSAIVANFNKPTPQAPSLLPHKDVETYFHEFGHIMHQVLTRAKYPRFSGTSVAQDFVEAPSQMLQNWIWQKDILESLSGHYKDRSQKLPPELLQKLLDAKNVNSGLKYLRQVFFATYDLTCHTREIPDTTALYAKLMEEIALIPMSPGTRPQAGFGHLMGGYDTAYYGYLWSEVYAQDMFSRFEKEGTLNPELGRQYRRLILEPGGSVEEGLSLRTFLGREPNEEAFLRNIGLQTR